MQKNVIFTILFSTFSLFSIECLGPCNPEPECERDFFNLNCRFIADGEFLYWTTEVNAVDYALQVTETPLTANCAIGDYKIAKYDYDPAFRVALRYYHAIKYWEATLQYTRFTNTGRDSVEDNSLFVTPTYLDNLGVDTIIKATSTIDLDYNLLDFTAARVFDPNPHLRIRFLAGLTGAWIEQKWDVDYTSDVNQVSALQQKWTYKAIGYRTGVTADWFWFWDIYMTGRATIGLTVGKYENLSQQTSEDLPNPTESFRDSRYEDYRLSTHFQLLLGPSYQCVDPCWDFEIFAGYEFNAWSNIHEVFRCQDDGNYSRTLINNGLLGMHGLTLRVTVAY